MIIIMVLLQSQQQVTEFQPKTEMAEKLEIIGATLNMNRVN